MIKIITPENNNDCKDISRLIFLEGPPDELNSWRTEAIRILGTIPMEDIGIAFATNYLKQPYDASQSLPFWPSYILNNHELLDWKLKHLQRAKENGAIMYWIENSIKDFSSKKYAQALVFELHNFENNLLKYNMSIGARNIEAKHIIGHKIDKMSDQEAMMIDPVYRTIRETCGGACIVAGEPTRIVQSDKKYNAFHHIISKEEANQMFNDLRSYLENLEN